MRYPTHREVRLFALLIATILFAMSGCCVRTTQPRSLIDAAQAAVKIESTCGGRTWGGSGTVMDELHVLTALHVVDCAVAPLVWVTTFDGVRHWMTVDLMDRNADVARLTAWRPLGAIQRPEIGEAAVGEVACSSVLLPLPGGNCGEVLAVHRGLYGILTTAVTQHGNSGAGIYISGVLVGVVTHAIVTGGGYATPIYNLHPDWF